jgi:hypothetical protein
MTRSSQRFTFGGRVFLRRPRGTRTASEFSGAGIRGHAIHRAIVLLVVVVVVIVVSGRTV